jgi:hypothetical protein
MHRARPILLALVGLALAAPGCGASETDEASPPAPAATDTSAAGLPGPVADTRAVILAAADAGDYEQLRSVLNQKVFLSDYGFGDEQPDPIAKWQELGPGPLEMMNALLHMRHVVRETNEGTLYEWPILTPDSSPEDLTSAERDLFLTFMSEDELQQAFAPEYGYTAPRLGILADGTWWFFIAEQGP